MIVKRIMDLAGFKRLTFYMAMIMIFSLSTLMLISPVKSDAEETRSDYKFYAPSYDEMRSTLSTSLNDWAKYNWLSFTKAEKGVRYTWLNAPQNVRLGSPSPISADGLHITFDHFSKKGSANSFICITLSVSAAYSDYVPNTNANYLARLPFALVIDPATGTVTTFASKAFSIANSNEISHVIIENNDALKAENLTDRLWEVTMKKQSDGQYKVTIAGITATIPERYILDSSSTLDLTNCYFVLNTWNDSNSFSIDLISFHGGESACADTISSENLSQAMNVLNKINAIGTIRFESKASILDARSSYDSLPSDLKSLLKHFYGTLTIAEEVYNVVAAINDIGNVTINSKSKIDTAEKKYNTLTDDKKLLVSNYQTFANAKTEYLKLAYKESDNIKDWVASSSEDTINSEPGDTDGTQSEVSNPSESSPNGMGNESKSGTKTPIKPVKPGDKKNLIPTIAFIAVIVTGVVLLLALAVAYIVIYLKRKGKKVNKG